MSVGHEHRGGVTVAVRLALATATIKTLLGNGNRTIIG
jgi:hypothetical protein